MPAKKPEAKTTLEKQKAIAALDLSVSSENDEKVDIPFVPPRQHTILEMFFTPDADGEGCMITIEGFGQNFCDYSDVTPPTGEHCKKMLYKIPPYIPITPEDDEDE